MNQWEADESNAIVREAEDFDRGNVLKDQTNYGKGIGVLVNRGELPNFVEYDIEMETAATCQFRFRYSAAEARPCHLIVNGKKISESICGEVTGGWLPDHQRWQFEAICKLKKGKNTIRIEQSKFFPHIDKFAFQPISGFDSEESSKDLVPFFVQSWAKYLQNENLKTDSFFQNLYQLASADRQELRSAVLTDALNNPSVNSKLKQLVHDPKGPFGVSDPRQLESAFSQKTSDALSEIRKQKKEHDQRKPTIPTAMAVSDEPQPHNLRVHLRGSHLTLGDEVPRRFPRIIPVSQSTHVIPKDRSGRFELAEWLTDKNHPLTSRVIVNRIWKWHFGTGLVRSPDNFGRLGERPTHPQLLDWLAVRFVESNWSIKWLHRLIMNSSAYQMSVQAEPAVLATDPENKLYSHANRRRLEAEAIRDSLMSVADNLDLRMGGTQLTTTNRSYVTSTANVNPNVYGGNKRSIYLPVVRSAVFEVLQAFDFPDPAVINGKRQSTTVAPQSLFMMNSQFVESQSKELAAIVLSGSQDPFFRVQDAYVRAFGRRPTQREVDVAVDYLNRVTKLFDGKIETAELSAYQSLCRAILSSNEFIYLE